MNECTGLFLRHPLEYLCVAPIAKAAVCVVHFVARMTVFSFPSPAKLILLSSLPTASAITAASSGSGGKVSKCTTLRKGKIQRSYQRRMSCLSSKRTTPNPALLRGAGGAEPSLDSSGTDKTGEAPQLLSWSSPELISWRRLNQRVVCRRHRTRLYPGSVYKSMAQVASAAGVPMVTPGAKA